MCCWVHRLELSFFRCLRIVSGYYMIDSSKTESDGRNGRKCSAVDGLWGCGLMCGLV